MTKWAQDLGRSAALLSRVVFNSSSEIDNNKHNFTTILAAHLVPQNPPLRMHAKPEHLASSIRQSVVCSAAAASNQKNLARVVDDLPNGAL